MERELFGHLGVAGHALHRGLAERARGGILFLDEIAELPLALQAKLLRLVETREYHRVGGEQSMVFHGRIVCATNRDLQELVHAGRFREDFYYRIAGMAVDVPPLRQRREDIASLIQHFFDDFKGNRGARLKGVSPLTFETAADYPWPGNAREVRNRVERAIALAKSEWVMPRDLFPDLAEVLPTFHEAILGSKFPTLSEARDRAEKRQIERALRETDGHHIAAAKLLGISRTTLWEKMRRLDIAD
jgi:DNA-binding NtrC family response regulator